MTLRERNLAIGVVGAIVVFGGIGLVRSAIIAPRARLQSELAAERARADDQEKRSLLPATTFAAWEAQTRRTLGLEGDKVSGAFRDDVSELLVKHKLTKDLTISPRDPRTVQKSIRKGFSEVGLQVSVKGTLDNLVGFLHEFYQRPYQKRVSRMSVSVEGGSATATSSDAQKSAKAGGKGAASSGKSEPTLNISLTLTTLMLPRNENRAWTELGHPVFDPKQPGDARPDTLALELAGYQVISKVNPFKMYAPPPAGPIAKVPDTQPRIEPDHPKPPARPNHHVLVYTASLNGMPIAYVDESGKKTETPVAKHLNEKVDDGTLVLVHPQGMVVRAHPHGGGDPKFYFYPLGASFKERVEAPGFEAEFPEVARELKLVLNR